MTLSIKIQLIISTMIFCICTSIMFGGGIYLVQKGLESYIDTKLITSNTSFPTYYYDFSELNAGDGNYIIEINITSNHEFVLFSSEGPIHSFKINNTTKIYHLCWKDISHGTFLLYFRDNSEQNEFTIYIKYNVSPHRDYLTGGLILLIFSGFFIIMDLQKM